MISAAITKTRIVLVACLALMVTSVFVGYAQRKPPIAARGWLQSQSSVVRLGAWDKAGTSKSNKLVFVVTGPDGKEYRSERPGPPSDWVYASFPDDFTPYPYDVSSYLKYSWKCVVDNRVVASGEFYFGKSKVDTTTPY